MLEIWTNVNCVWCERAKALLKEKNVCYATKVMDRDFTRDELKIKFPEARSFPVVVLDKRFLGGYTELLDHITTNPIKCSTCEECHEEIAKQGPVEVVAQE